MKSKCLQSLFSVHGVEPASDDDQPVTVRDVLATALIVLFDLLVFCGLLGAYHALYLLSKTFLY